jgi:hypothetical protein
MESLYSVAEWNAIEIAPVATTAPLGAISLLLCVYFYYTGSVKNKTSVWRNRPFRWFFVLGWLLVGFAITWGTLVRLNTCGSPRGTVVVDNILKDRAGAHLVVRTRRLPFVDKSMSAVRSIPSDADKDEGPSGKVVYYSSGDAEPTTLDMKKIETKGRTMHPHLMDSYVFDLDKKGKGEEVFGMAGAPYNCRDYVLRSGMKDFSHYGDVLLSGMVPHTLRNVTGKLRAAKITPVPVHLYFQDMDCTDCKLEYEGVSLLVPKWHAYECAYESTKNEEIDEDMWDPGDEDFQNLILEQTTRDEKAQLSLFGSKYYPIRSRSENFNRASLDAQEKNAPDMVKTIDRCYTNERDAVDAEQLARVIAFNQLIPSWDMYMSSAYVVVDASPDATDDTERKCYPGPLWDREITMPQNTRIPATRMVEPNTFWSRSRSLYWQMVDYHMTKNAATDGVTLAKRIQNAAPLVKNAHNGAMAWIQQHREILEAGADRWHIPGEQCHYGWYPEKNLNWGAENDESRVPGVFNKVFDERYEWLRSSDADTLLDERVNAYSESISDTILGPQGALPLIIVISILLFVALVLEANQIIYSDANSVGFYALVDVK